MLGKIRAHLRNLRLNLFSTWKKTPQWNTELRCSAGLRSGVFQGLEFIV